MSDDIRLYFIRNIEALKGKGVKSHVNEYEIITDAHIVGSIKYGPYDMMIWEFSRKKTGEDRKLILRIKEAFPLIDRTKKYDYYSGYYHGGHIAEEVIFFSSLFLRRRLKLGPIVRSNGVPRYFSFQEKSLVPNLYLVKVALKNYVFGLG